MTNKCCKGGDNSSVEDNCDQSVDQQTRAEDAFEQQRMAKAKTLSSNILPSTGIEIMHRLGHKRAKSAGSSVSPDFGLYTATGLYAHHNSFRADSGRKPLVNRFTASDINVSIVDYSFALPLKETNVTCVEAFWQQNEEGNKWCLLISQFKCLFAIACDDESEDVRNCGLLSYRPKCLQRFARIEVFVFLSCILVTIQQALSSGYFNSVITTIEKRFDIPSGLSGAVASTFELGNLLTVIFVSYFGTNRHIPVWLGKGVLVTGIGSLLFAVPHFMDTNNPLENVNISGPLDDNICHIPMPALQSPYAERASRYINPPSQEADPSLCVDGGTYKAPHILIFMLAMVLIGCGGTPIFTLGTIYIDDHVKKESSSMFIGCMYSMVAFGLVCGFLLGGFFITIHENSFGSGTVPPDIYNGHPKWIGAWWAGFILLGILLILISFPFFMFPKRLKKKSDKKEIENCTTTTNVTSASQSQKSSENLKVVAVQASTDGDNKCTEVVITQPPSTKKEDYGRKLGDIPSCMWRLLTNPVYIVTCLGSCMELCIVSGFLVFLPKYLETQFTISKSQANLYAGGIAVPGACIGIFLGGYLLKRFQMKPKGAIQFVLFFNIVCMGLYTALYFLGCDNIKMAGATHPYFNSTLQESFQVNLTADCNMGCGCSPNDIEPICGENGITYFSP
ncbi:solute carrier organic anion transporter family member 5A1-like protein, partial [Leptotrombidium deliense]